jgi:hypothetical protein
MWSFEISAETVLLCLPLLVLWDTYWRGVLGAPVAWSEINYHGWHRLDVRSFCAFRSCIKMVDRRRYHVQLTDLYHFATEHFSQTNWVDSITIPYNSQLLYTISSLNWHNQWFNRCNYPYSFLNYNEIVMIISTSYRFRVIVYVFNWLLRFNLSYHHKTTRLWFETWLEHIAYSIIVTISIVMLLFSSSGDWNQIFDQLLNLKLNSLAITWKS